MPENHLNEDGSYTCYVKDTNGNIVPVTLPAGPMAEGIFDYDRYESNQNDYWRQNMDFRIENAKVRVSSTDTDENLDPIEQLVDESADVHAQAFPEEEEQKEKREVIETRRIVSTVSENRKAYYERRFVDDIKQADIAKERGVSRAAMSKQEKKLKDEVKEKLTEVGIDDAFFENRRHR